MKITLSLTLSAYMLDRFSTRSVIASLLLRTTISWPKSRRYRTSVSFRGQYQNRNRTTSERTIAISQRSDVFPERNTHVEIQDIPQDRITLGTWGIRRGGSLPFLDESEDKSTKEQRIEDGYVNHGDKEKVVARSLSNASCECDDRWTRESLRGFLGTLG